MNILVSACLLGVNCRYNGISKEFERLCELSEHNLIPVCPEIYGGLPTPRPPAEQVGERVINALGDDVTDNYLLGALNCLKIAKRLNCKYAILKERSPSCGKGIIYDGSFSGNLTDGDGVATRIFLENGITVFGESEIEKAKEILRENNV